MSLNLHTKSIIVVTGTANISSTFWVAKQLACLGVDGIITKRARKAASGHGFLEDVEATLIDKTQTCDPFKKEYYWLKTLKTLYPDGLNLESGY